MGFKLPGKSIQVGTSAHSSALKMKKESMAKMYKDSPVDKALVGKQENLPEDLKAKIEASPAKQKAYGGTKTWAQGQKDSGGTLNEITRGQKAYEKKMKEKDPSWNKREDNNWKKTQNKINAAVGSKKVYDVTKDIATKNVDRDNDGKKETEVMRGIGSNRGKTLTTTEKSLEKANISTQKDIVKKSKGDKKSATTTEGKNKAKNTRDKAQKEIGEIRGGRDNAKTGTVVSRFLGRRKAKRNERQLKRRAEKNSPAKQKEEKKVKIQSGENTEYVKGGREGDKKSKHISYSKPDEGGKVTKTTMKVKKKAFGPSKIKTKTKTISAKKAARQQKRKDKRHTTIEE